MWSTLSDINFYENLLKKRVAADTPLSESDVNFQKICRTCLRDANDTGNLLKDFEIGAMNFEYAGRLLKLMDMVAETTGLEVSETDTLPHQVCNNCIQNLCGAYFFRLQCKKADNLLHRMYTSLNPPQMQFHWPDTTKSEDKTTKTDSDLAAVKEAEGKVEVEQTADEANDEGSIEIELFPENDNEYNVKVMSVEFDGVRYKIDSELFNVEDAEMIETEEDKSVPVYLEESKSDEAEDGNGAEEPNEEKLEKIRIEIIGNEKNPPETVPEPTKKRRRMTKKKKGNVSSVANEPEDKKFCCETCDAIFTKVQSLKRHIKIHQSDQKNKLCTFCGKGFIRADDLSRHIRTHTGERPYACALCPKRYKQTSELKEHVLTHSKEKTFICNICGKALQTRNGHYVHMRSHLGLKKHVCDHCGNRYVTSGELNSHIRHIHEKRKPFQCRFGTCTRKFGTKSSLEIHERSHTGERPFECTICNKRLATQSSLSDHARIHLRVNENVCKTCNKVSRTKEGLIRHMKTHQRIINAGPYYECATCARHFQTLEEMQAHNSEHCTGYNSFSEANEDDPQGIENVEDEESQASQNEEVYIIDMLMPDEKADYV